MRKVSPLFLLIPFLLFLSTSLTGCVIIKVVKKKDQQSSSTSSIASFYERERGAEQIEDRREEKVSCHDETVECLSSGRSKLEDLKDKLESGDPAQIAEARQTIYDAAERNGEDEETLKSILTASPEDLLEEIDERLALPDCSDVQDDPECKESK